MFKFVLISFGLAIATPVTSQAPADFCMNIKHGGQLAAENANRPGRPLAQFAAENANRPGRPLAQVA